MTQRTFWLFALSSTALTLGYITGPWIMLWIGFAWA